jgi:hypothetical protein
MGLTPAQAANTLAAVRVAEGRRKRESPEGWRLDHVPDRSPEEDDD